MNRYEKIADYLQSVSPNSPMTDLALRIGLSSEAGHPVSEQEIDQAPRIPEGATRAEYANVLREK